MEYFNKLALFDIVKLVGKPIKVDFGTDSISCARYARVCIEVHCPNLLYGGSGWSMVGNRSNMRTLTYYYEMWNFWPLAG